MGHTDGQKKPGIEVGAPPKNSQPDNVELQNLHCPPQIGGEVDVLMGILYQNIFPQPIHSLESGLTIYKMRVTPHDSNMDAVLVVHIRHFSTWLRSLEELPYYLQVCHDS